HRLGAQVVHHDLVEGPAEVPRHRLADVAEADESDPPHALAHGPPRRALVAAPPGIIPPHPADPPQPPAPGAPPSLLVLGASVSPFVRKVRSFINEKGLAYEHDPVNPFSPPDGWREVSPLGRIPALRDGERTLADSSVVCAYLERRFPAPALYPSDPFEYARALWFE